jgi:hypothetical protein
MSRAPVTAASAEDDREKTASALSKFKESVMKNSFSNIRTLSAALLLATAGFSAHAAGVGVSTGNGGVSVGTTGTGDTGATASATGNGASVGIGSGGETGTVTIGTGNGSLATANSDGSDSAAAVNLGGLLGNLSNIAGTTDGVGGLGVGNVTALSTAISGLSPGDQQELKTKCRDVLALPSTHPSNIVAVCKLIASL